MSLVSDILRSYRAPGLVARNRVSHSSEAKALATLMCASLIIFVAQWPRLAREAHFDPSMPLDARIVGALFGLLFIMPLAAYVFGMIIWMSVRVIRGPVPGLHVRVALFWSLLVVAPLWLAHGFFAGLFDKSVAVDVIGLIALLAFIGVLFGALRGVSDQGLDA